MSLLETIQPKKSNKTLWIIIVVAAVILLCCILAAALSGLFYYLKQNGMLPASLSADVPTPTVTKAPAVVSEALTIEPANPSSSSYPTLEQLVPDWRPTTTPSSRSWSISVSPDEPALVFLGWCTTTAEILDQNYQHITYKLSVDGQPVDVKSLYLLNSQDADQVCRTYVGLIRHWTGTQHTIVTTTTFSQKINDGWDDYPAGDYTDTYNITVSP